MITRDLSKISYNQGSSCGDSSLVCQFGEDVSSVLVDNVGSSDNEDSNSSYRLSPGGHRYYTPVCCGDVNKPIINQVFDSLEAAYVFYKQYGRSVGFDVRKTTESKEKGFIVLKHFVCSKEGFNDYNDTSSDQSVSNAKRRRTVSSRCGCKAKIVVKIFPGSGKYFVFKFSEEHNHPLVDENGRQFLRSSREMSISSRNFVFNAGKVNIGCSKSYALMKEMVGSYSNVGATLRDFRNFNRDLKAYVGDRDAQMIIEKFKVMQEGSRSFYFAYEVDEGGHLIKLFWADAIGRRNFDIYGDAVSFDATFDTNKYNMIFAPFTGVDKHDKCVTFASCLLSKEDISHYTWVFDHFVKAMGRNPVIIVTDQCPAMKVAISASFSSKNGLPASKHRLCMWHIMEKFPIKLGNRLCKDTDFMEKMKKYIWSSNLEIAEFESGWQAVLKEFNLENNKWLCDMYAIRYSWIPAFFRDQPMYGLMRTTSRSESENFFFGQFHKQGDTLCEFWVRFQTAMERQRNETERLDHESKSSLPNNLSTWFLEDDAADIFTRAIFYKIQEEIIAACLDMQIKRMSEEVSGVTHFEIRDVKVKDKIFKVSVSNNHAVCSCNKFVMYGLVCRHSFCGLKNIGVTKFPRSLVLNRWMKNAETGTSLDLVEISRDFLQMEQVSQKLTNIWFDFRQVVNKVGIDMTKLEYVHSQIKEMNSYVDSQAEDLVVFSKKDHMAAMVGKEPQGEISILPPNQCKNKGNYFKATRLISEREKAMNKAKKNVRRCKKCRETTHDARTCGKFAAAREAEKIEAARQADNIARAQSSVNENAIL